jgi:hypothetical protein
LASRKQKGNDDSIEVDVEAGEGKRSAEPTAGASVPRWRQIEVMHERAQLRRMLDDLVMDFDELEMEVFGSDAEHDLIYRHLEEDEEEDEELEDALDDDEFEDDDFEEIED